MDHREHPAYRRDEFPNQAAPDVPVERVVVRPEIEVEPVVEVRPSTSGPVSVQPRIFVAPEVEAADVEALVRAAITVEPTVVAERATVSVTVEQPRWLYPLILAQSAAVAVLGLVALFG